MTEPRSGLLLATLLAAAGCGQSGPEAPAVGLLERDRIELTAEAPEPIAAVHVAEGDRVEAGRALVTQTPQRLARQQDALAAKVRQAQGRLHELLRGPREEDIRAARSRLAGARAAVKTQRRELQRLRALAKENLASAADLDRQRLRLDEAVSRRGELKAHLAAMLEGTTVEALDQARAALEAARGELAALEVRIDRLSVEAPTDAIVDALPYHVGERPPAGKPLVVLLKAGSPHARIHLPAALRARVSAGMEARVSVEGRRDPYRGTLRYIASEASYTPYYALNERDRGRLSYLAEVALTGPSAAELPSGVPVVVRFPAIGETDNE